MRTREQISATEMKSARKIYHPMVSIHIRRDSGIYERLQKAAERNCCSMQQYMISATRRCLQEEGYYDEEQN